MLNSFSDEELLQVITERVRKYTSNESTSVTYQTARQLMSSILYCMQTVSGDEFFTQDKEKEHAIYHRNISAVEAFQLGLSEKKIKIKKAKNLYETILDSFDSYYNECYQDTIIEGMKVFFERYDVEFDAVNHLLTLDYPLICEVRQLKGIDLIYEYLYRTSLEQRFLKHFNRDSILEIMYSYHPDYQEHIINVAKIVFQNVMGCLLIGKSIHNLSIEEKERIEIEKVFHNKSLEDISKILKQTLDELIQEEFKSDKILLKYFNNEVKEFSYNLKNCLENKCLGQLFMEVKEKEIRQEAVFEEGSSMDNEELRLLIKDMSNRSIENRIKLVKKKVRSLTDLKEIIAECFFQEEYDCVFALLSSDERNVLLEEINQKVNFDEELKEWEKRLTSY